MRKFICVILMLLFAFLTLAGCMAAENGCKKISGETGRSAVFSFTREGETARLTMFGDSVDIPLSF